MPDKLRFFDKDRLLNSENPFNMAEIHDISSDRYLQMHPESSYMSYHIATKNKYKDLPSYIRKFRCKKCELYGQMKAIGDDKNSGMVVALICANCRNLVKLDMPLDPQNVAAGIDKRPELMGRSTKMKEKLSESQKLGIDKALRKTSPDLLSQKTFLMKDSAITSSGATFNQIVRKNLRKLNLPMPSNEGIIKKNYDPEDMQYNRFMQGKSIIKERTVYNTNQLEGTI